MRFPAFRSPLLATLALSATALLAGCATGDGSSSGGFFSSSSGGALRDPLLDAPYHSEVTCTTERPVTVLSRIRETPFACPDLGVSVMLDELRDAGWRVVSLGIGDDAESESHVGFPVTVLIRKLY